MDGYGIGWDLCVGLFYEHRFAMLIIRAYICALLEVPVFGYYDLRIVELFG